MRSLMINLDTSNGKEIVPILKSHTVFELARNVSLSLDVKASVAGLESLVNKLGSHPKARAALTKLNVRPTATSNGAARRPVARGNGSAPPETPSGNSDRQQSLARQNQKLKRELAQARDATRSSTSLTEDPPVFFVVGLAKSGTSWLMRTLDGHPEILCRGEGRFFGGEWRRENFREWQNPVLASSLYNALLSSEHLKLWIERSVWTRDGDPEEHLTNLTHVAVNYFLTEALAKTGKKIVGDKTPLLSPRFVEEIHLIYPEAKVIHIVRDGRDSAVSMIHHVWNSSDRGGIQKIKPEELEKREAYRRNPRQVLEAGEGIFTEERLRVVAESWRTRVGKTIEDGPTLFGSNYVEVRYEDLLEHPHEEVGRLAAFLGVDSGDKAVEQAVASASFEKLSKGRERGEEDPGSFYRKGISGDWKNYFTERDKVIFKEAAGDLLIKLGYEKDLSW